ncbi:class I SAM-dependent methyltransferase [Deinococcus sp. SM5_A1]|uniref:class I SAM-dependent methyltransferase n=1 Tax=Deinococcus sp. SM5_A1 TaxID=3379094 RepID=UPI00385A05D4
MPPESRLARRDALLSRLTAVGWPHQPLLEALNLPPNADLLDIGAGEGALVKEWRRRSAGRGEGIDPSPGAGIHRGVAEALPYMAGAFDVALLVRTLSHLPDAGAALREAWRVLRPGGQLVLATHDADHLRATWHALGRPAADGGPEQSMRSVLREAGRFGLRLDVRFPIKVTAADARELVGTYGLSIGVNEQRFPVRDTAHLAVYVAYKTD